MDLLFLYITPADRVFKGVDPDHLLRGELFFSELQDRIDSYCGFSSSVIMPVIGIVLGSNRTLFFRNCSSKNKYPCGKQEGGADSDPLGFLHV